MRYSKKSLDLYEALVRFGCSFSDEELSSMLNEHPMDFHEEYFKVAEERKEKFQLYFRKNT